MIVLDTTVLVYAVGDDRRFRDPCRRLVAAVEAGTVTATTTPEVIGEFVHVRSRRRSREDAVVLGRAFTDLLAPLLVVDEQALVDGLEIFGSSVRLGSFDAVLAAACVGGGAVALVSADAAFDEVSGLDHVVPDADGVARLGG